MFSRLFSLFALAGTAFAQSPTPAVFDLWPEGKMPGQGAKEPEAEVQRDDGFHRITNVSEPTLTLFLAPQKAGAGAAPGMIVCPGGGYNYTVVDKEGSEIAAWLNSVGISALVLKYRTPNNRAGALQDAQRALSEAREHAAEWNIDPQQVGIIGFSAGGNLAAKASTSFEVRTYPAIDAVDQKSCRPDFAVLVYPAYLDDKNGHTAPDLNLKAQIPPTLIVHNEDDKVHVVGSKVYDAALTEAKVAHEFKLYPTGGHGYGLHCQGDARAWPGDTLKWLQKVLPAFGATDVPAGFTSLVADRDLTGWQDAASAAEHWKVVNGELINDGQGTDLVTAKSYRNFELRLEWKIPLKGDSGVFLPGGQQVQIWAKESGSGGFVFNHKYSVSPASVADKPLGEWNAFQIKLIDGKVTVTLNGKVVMQDVPVEKGFDPPMRGPEEGPLRLQKSPHNVMTTFRNVFIREL